MILNIFALLIALPSLMAYKRYGSDDLTERKAEEGFTCIEELVCFERKPEEFSEMIPSNCTELHEVAYTAMAEVIEEKYVGPPEVFFDTFDDKLCEKPFYERMDEMKEMSMKISEDFVENNCETEDTDYCICYFMWFENIENIIDYWTKEGVCNNPERTAKHGRDQMMSAPGMGAFG